MVKRVLTFTIAVAAMFAGGCVSEKQILRIAIETAEQSARSDMGCEGLTSKQLGKTILPEEEIFYSEWGMWMLMNIRVSGCGKTATYATKCLPDPNAESKISCTAELDSITGNGQ